MVLSRSYTYVSKLCLHTPRPSRGACLPWKPSYEVNWTVNMF